MSRKYEKKYDFQIGVAYLRNSSIVLKKKVKIEWTSWLTSWQAYVVSNDGIKHQRFKSIAHS